MSTPEEAWSTLLKRFFYATSGNLAFGLWVLLASVGLNALFALVDPLILKTLIDEGLMSRNLRAFVSLAGVVVLFGVAVRFGMLGYELLSQRLRNRVAEALSLRMLRSYYRLAYRHVLKAEEGYFLSRVYDEPAKVGQGISSTWIALATQITTFFVAAGVSLFLAWRITLLLAFIVPALYFLANRFKPKISAASKVENEEEARLREVLTSAVRSYTTVKMFDLESKVTSQTRGRLSKYLAVLYSRVKTSRTFQTASDICLTLAEAIVLVAAGYEVVNGRLSLGGLFGFMNAFWKLVGAARGVINIIPELAKLDGYIERLVELENAGEQDEPLANASTPVLSGVSFSYNGNKALDGIDLAIGNGESVLIVGPNGSGKSTLAHILTRFLEPDSGSADIPARDRMSAMLSSFHFIPGTLKDNVAYELLGPEKRELFHRLVDDFGLREKIDEEPGTQYSQGQKKKAQIIMTLLKDADFYIFDEPLANVDPESKGTILEWQFNRSAGGTLISIMHGDQAFAAKFSRTIRLS